MYSKLLVTICPLAADIGAACTNPDRLCTVNAYCGNAGVCECVPGASLVGSTCVFPTGNTQKHENVM